MTAAFSTVVQIDVYFDLICPWCWIGKTNLEAAGQLLTKHHPEVELQVRWHSVQLMPQVPPQGWPYQAFYKHQLCSPEAIRIRRSQVQDAAVSAGLSIHHERIAVFPNTWSAHRLLAYAEHQHPEQHAALIETMFEAFFVRGLDIGDPQVMATLAQAHGVDSAAAEDFEASFIESMPDGANGVPLFVFNQRQVVSGAQPSEALWSALQTNALSAA